jgi:hypothetical protein
MTTTVINALVRRYTAKLSKKGCFIAKSGLNIPQKRKTRIEDDRGSPANTGPNDHLPLLSLSLPSLWKKPLPLSVQIGTLNVFETTIRYVGGLLTAYSFTGDPMFRCTLSFNYFSCTVEI